MDKDNAIVVKDLSKTFKVIENRNYTIRDAVSNVFKHRNFKTINALNDINLKIAKGEKIGVIGRNGSGKSTLLKIIAGVYPPDKGGEVVINGKCVRLALGTGFNFEFSARQNIYINGSLLGMSFKKIGEKFEQILDFSGLHGFVDTKLKYYSSGMVSRLAFAIAINTEADIFLLDEFFGGVGDEDFQRKSTEAFKKSVIEDKTLIIVSHSLDVIRKSCDRVIWLEEGGCVAIGHTEDILQSYLSHFNN
jgi:ABC-2 type transport system ATP-binding protein